MLNQYNSIECLSVVTLKSYPKNARTHSKKQIRQIADSITRFGFTNPSTIRPNWGRRRILHGDLSYKKPADCVPQQAYGLFFYVRPKSWRKL